MASNWIIRRLTVICLLSASIMLGGCSPPAPKIWAPPSGLTLSNSMSVDRHLAYDDGLSAADQR
jgi:hypothetical protein